MSFVWVQWVNCLQMFFSIFLFLLTGQLLLLEKRRLQKRKIFPQTKFSLLNAQNVPIGRSLYWFNSRWSEQINERISKIQSEFFITCPVSGVKDALFEKQVQGLNGNLFDSGDLRELCDFIALWRTLFQKINKNESSRHLLWLKICCSRCCSICKDKRRRKINFFFKM